MIELEYNYFLISSESMCWDIEHQWLLLSIIKKEKSQIWSASWWWSTMPLVVLSKESDPALIKCLNPVACRGHRITAVRNQQSARSSLWETLQHKWPTFFNRWTMRKRNDPCFLKRAEMWGGKCGLTNISSLSSTIKKTHTHKEIIRIKVRIVVTLEGTRACGWDKDTHRVSGKAGIVQFTDPIAVTNTLAL